MEQTRILLTEGNFFGDSLFGSQYDSCKGFWILSRQVFPMLSSEEHVLEASCIVSLLSSSCLVWFYFGFSFSLFSSFLSVSFSLASLFCLVELASMWLTASAMLLWQKLNRWVNNCNWSPPTTIHVAAIEGHWTCMRVFLLFTLLCSFLCGLKICSGFMRLQLLPSI